MSEVSTPLLDTALCYASHGLHVFPVGVEIIEGKKKVTPITNWDDQSTTHEGRIRFWFGLTGQYRAASLAIDCGKSGLVVVDPDGAEGVTDWEQFRAQHHLGATWADSTPGGGQHWYYRADPQHLVKNSTSKIASKIDIRGVGGFVIAPPSRDDRGVYHWFEGEPDWTALPVVPQAVVDAVSGSRASSNTPFRLPDHHEGLMNGDQGASARRFTHEQAVVFCEPYVEVLREAPDGQINDRLNTAAKVLSHFIPAFWSEQHARKVLHEALRSTVYDGKTWQADATIDSALRSAATDWTATKVKPWAGDPTGADEPTAENFDIPPHQPIDWKANDLIEQLDQWQDLPDIAHILASLAVAVTAADDEGEPAWLLLVAPPSSGKTETVRLFDEIAQVRLDEVTIGGLLSWRPRGRGKPPVPSGVLSRVTHGLLTLGDLSTLLATSDRGGRDQVFAALRRVYDGHYVRDVAVPGGGGTSGPLTWDGKLTVLGAVTGAIDGYSAHADQLGSRWLYCRIGKRDTEAKRRASALARHSGLAEKRQNARSLTTDVVNTACTRLPHIVVGANALQAIEDAALVCCWGRAAVPRHGYGRREIDGPVIVEEPMRVIRQLGTIARGLTALGCAGELVTAVCRRLALDSMPAPRRAVLDVLSLRTDDTDTTQSARAAGIDRSVARRALEDLEAVGIVCGERHGEQLADEAPDWRRCTWHLVGSDGALVTDVFDAAAKEEEALRKRGSTHRHPK